MFLTIYQTVLFRDEYSSKMERNRKPQLINRVFYQRTIGLALPISIQAVLVATLGIADVAMVGSLGDRAVAAVGLGAKLHFVTILIMAGLGSACSILIAQYMGAGKSQKLKETLFMTVVTGALVLLPIVGLFMFSPSSWLQFLTNDAQVLELTATYLQITALTVLAIAVITSIESALRAMSQTTLPLILACVAIVTNVLLNYILIFGHWGAPELGVAGAAWATLASRLLHALLLASYLYLRKHRLAIYREDLITVQHRGLWKKYWLFALPISFNFGLWGFGSTVYHFIASGMGMESLAVMSVITPIDSVIMAMFIGVSGAAAILLGEALGADKHDDAWLIKNFFMRYTPLFGMLMCGILWLLKPLVLAPFSDLNPETLVTINQTYLLLCVLTWIKVHNLMAIISVLRSGGDNNWCLKLDVTAMWIVGIPATAITGLVFNWPFEWVFVVMYSEELIKMIGARWRMEQKKWMNNLTRLVSVN